MKIQVFENEYELKDEVELRQHLRYRYKEVYGAFWLCREEPELSLFINDDKAWLYYIPSNSEGMMSSVNPESSVSEEDEIDFYIENYQLDSVSESSVVSLESGIRAFVHFYKYGEIGDQVLWG